MQLNAQNWSDAEAFDATTRDSPEQALSQEIRPALTSATQPRSIAAHPSLTVPAARPRQPPVAPSLD